MSAGVGVPGHVVWDAPLTLTVNALLGWDLEAVAHHPDDRLEGARQTHEHVDQAVTKHFPGVHDAIRIHLRLEGTELAHPFRPKDRVCFAREKAPGGIGMASLFFGNFADGQG